MGWSSYKTERCKIELLLLDCVCTNNVVDGKHCILTKAFLSKENG